MSLTQLHTSFPVGVFVAHGDGPHSLAEAVGVSVETITRLEGLDGPLVSGRHATIQGVEKALKEAGVIFIDADSKLGPGVRLKLRK